MRTMSAMVMCPDQTNSASAMYPRYPSLPMNYPCNGFGYNAPGVQHPHDYSQSQMNDPGVQTWYSAMYGGRSEDWTYAAPNTGAMVNNPTGMGAYPYRTGPMELDYNQSHGAVVSSISPGDTSSTSSSSASTSNKQLRPPYDWMKKAAYQTAPLSGKTRTKDKYRVVYSDHQRLELEKEFHYSRYITIRRKTELAQTLALSERQVKIWFQNRRAKERKQNKKRDENKVVQIASEHDDHTDETKLHMQQQINMQITPHAHHQVTSPSTESINVHNAYTYHHCQAQPHIIPNSSISPQNHVTNHNQYPSNQLNIPLSPETMAQSTACPDSLVTIKADLDDKAS